MNIKLLFLTMLFIISEQIHAAVCSDFLEANKVVKKETTIYEQVITINQIESDNLITLPSFKRSTKAFLDIITFKKVRKTIEVQEIGSKEDVYLGFLENGHVYLVINGERLDGEALYLPPRFRKSAFLTEGIVIKFKNPGEHIKQTLAEFVSSNGRPLSLTCSSGICAALKETLRLFDLNGEAYTTLFPSRLLEVVVTGKVKLENNLQPEVELYLLGDKGFPEMINSIKRSEISRPAPFVLSAAAISLIGLYIGLN